MDDMHFCCLGFKSALLLSFNEGDALSVAGGVGEDL
jgi:hypothetical protein